MWNVPAWFLLGILALPATASAQPSTSAAEQPFRRWDAGGGVNIRFGSANDEILPSGGWSAEGGRYWTAHFKTSLGLATFGLATTGTQGYSVQQLPRGFKLTETTPQPAAVSGTVTYQLYENVFAHPYVTSGLLLAWLSGTQRTYATSPVYQLLSTETFSTIQARPVIGGGFKSYFDNGRAFVRSELLMAIDPHGPPHALLRIGAGVDF
jgi:hypothetical protein